jgi:hypothetical protein
MNRKLLAKSRLSQPGYREILLTTDILQSLSLISECRMVKRNEKLAKQFLMTQQEEQAMEDESRKNVQVLPAAAPRRRAPRPTEPLRAARAQGRDERFHESVAKYRSEDHHNDVADGTAAEPGAPAAADGDLGSSDYDEAYEAALRREREADASFIRFPRRSPPPPDRFAHPAASHPRGAGRGPRGDERVGAGGAAR